MITTGQICSYQDLHHKVALICHNCCKFNGRDTDYGIVARDFEAYCDECIVAAVKAATVEAEKIASKEKQKHLGSTVDASVKSVNTTNASPITSSFSATAAFVAPSNNADKPKTGAHHQAASQPTSSSPPPAATTASTNAPTVVVSGQETTVANAIVTTGAATSPKNRHSSSPTVASNKGRLPADSTNVAESNPKKNKNISSPATTTTASQPSPSASKIEEPSTLTMLNDGSITGDKLQPAKNALATPSNATPAALTTTPNPQNANTVNLNMDTSKKENSNHHQPSSSLLKRKLPSDASTSTHENANNKNEGGDDVPSLSLEKSTQKRKT